MWILLLKSLPLAIPFLKELAFGSNIPKAGRVRNRLTPVIVLLAFLLCMVTAWSGTELYENYDQQQQAALEITTLKSKLDHEALYRKRIEEQFADLRKELGDLRTAANNREEALVNSQAREQSMAEQLRVAQETNKELRAALEGSIADNKKLLEELRALKAKPLPPREQTRVQKRYKSYMKLLEEQE